MVEYLYRVTIDYDYFYKGDKFPVYAVAESVEKVKEYVNRYLKQYSTVKSVALLGKRLGMNMYHGKPKKRGRR